MVHAVCFRKVDDEGKLLRYNRSKLVWEKVELPHVPYDTSTVAVGLHVVDQSRVFVLVQRDGMSDDSGFSLYHFVHPQPHFKKLGQSWRCIRRSVHAFACQKVRRVEEPAVVLVVTSRLLIPKEHKDAKREDLVDEKKEQIPTIRVIESRAFEWTPSDIPASSPSSLAQSSASVVSAPPVSVSPSLVSPVNSLSPSASRPTSAASVSSVLTMSPASPVSTPHDSLSPISAHCTLSNPHTDGETLAAMA